jgi:hypothetical protein
MWKIKVHFAIDGLQHLDPLEHGKRIGWRFAEFQRRASFEYAMDNHVLERRRRQLPYVL